MLFNEKERFQCRRAWMASAVNVFETTWSEDKRNWAQFNEASFQPRKWDNPRHLREDKPYNNSSEDDTIL